EIEPLLKMHFQYTGWLRAQKLIPVNNLKVGTNNVIILSGAATPASAIRGTQMQLKYLWEKSDYLLQTDHYLNCNTHSRVCLRLQNDQTNQAIRIHVAGDYDRGQHHRDTARFGDFENGKSDRVCKSNGGPRGHPGYRDAVDAI